MELFLTCGHYSADISETIAARPGLRVTLPTRGNRSPLCGRSAPGRVQAWVGADVLGACWEQGLGTYEALRGLAGAWLAMDGARTTAPLGGKRWASLQRILGQPVPSAACSPMALACPAAWWWTARIGRSSRWRERRVSGAPQSGPPPDAPPGLCLEKG